MTSNSYPTIMLDFGSVKRRAEQGGVYRIIAVHQPKFRFGAQFYVCFNHVQEQTILDELRGKPEPFEFLYSMDIWLTASSNKYHAMLTSDVCQDASEKRGNKPDQTSDDTIAKIGLINRPHHKMPVQRFLFDEEEIAVDEGTYARARALAYDLGDELRREGKTRVELYYSGLTTAIFGAVHGLGAAGLWVTLMSYDRETQTYFPVDLRDPYRELLRRIREALPDRSGLDPERSSAMIWVLLDTYGPAT